MPAILTVAKITPNMGKYIKLENKLAKLTKEVGMYMNCNEVLIPVDSVCHWSEARRNAQKNKKS